MGLLGPYMGQIVYVNTNAADNNGATQAAAMITQVINSTTVNIRVVPNTQRDPEWRPNCTIVATQQAGMGVCWAPPLSL